MPNWRFLLDFQRDCGRRGICGYNQLAEGVGFEPTRERYPLPVFKTGALNHSATLPYQQDQTLTDRRTRAIA
jgi:hypothetical protein